MLKFRSSNSMRARRIAEAQRKALEEKLKMEWAWKPMAAIMNEKESDLVYWVPPLYTSNLLTSFTASSSIQSSVSPSPSSSFRRASMQFPVSGGFTKCTPIMRRNSASLKRRPRLTPNQSIQEDENEEESQPSSSNSSPNNQEEQQEDNSMKKDKDQNNASVIEKDLTEESDTCEGTFKVGRRPMRQNAYRIRHSCPENISVYAQKQQKFHHIPTLYKVVNKLSQIYNLPKRANLVKKPMERNKEFRNSSIRRAKRPSVKIYNVPSSRSSIKKGKLSEANAIPDPYYVISKSKTTFDKRGSISNKNPNNRTHIGLPTMSENELHGAHLDMILRIMTNLYGEKLAEQTTEISHFKSKLLGQEKVLKQTAHLALELKEQLKTLQTRFDNCLKLSDYGNQGDVDSESLFNYHQFGSSIQESPSNASLAERHQFKTPNQVETESLKDGYNFKNRPFTLDSFDTDSIFENYQEKCMTSTVTVENRDIKENVKCYDDDKYADTQSMISYQIAINLSPKFSAPSSPDSHQPDLRFITTAEVHGSPLCDDENNQPILPMNIEDQEINKVSVI